MDVKEYLCSLDIELNEALELCRSSFAAFSYDSELNIFGATVTFGAEGEERTAELEVLIDENTLISINAEFRKGKKIERTLRIDFDVEELSLPYIPSEGLYYTFVDNGSDEQYYAVSGIGDCTDKFIVIPHTHIGFPVKAIPPSAFLGSDIEELIVSDGITDIGDCAFKASSALSYVYLGSTVENIGKEAFAFIDARAEVHFHDSVRVIGDDAFLSENSNNPQGKWFFYGDINKYATVSFGTVNSTPNLNRTMYVNGKIAIEIVIDTAEYISDYAFNACSAITSINISAAVTYIGSYSLPGGAEAVTVNYSGTVLQWQSITAEDIDISLYGTHSYKIACSDGDVWIKRTNEV